MPGVYKQSFVIVLMKRFLPICKDSLENGETDTLVFSLTSAVYLRLNHSVFSHKTLLTLRTPMSQKFVQRHSQGRAVQSVA